MVKAFDSIIDTATTSSTMTPPSTPEPENKIVDKQNWRDLTAFWFLGLCNNYGYVVMLSAAHDILKTLNPNEESHDPGSRNCNYISTGAILLADIVPALMIKFVAPFIPFYVHMRILSCCILASAGFILVAFAETEWIAVLGVVCTSLSSGLGEATFLSYSASFDKNVISTWSSGTGMAGIAGSTSYAGLIAAGLSPVKTLLVMLVVPVIEAISFWILLRRPKNNIDTASTVESDSTCDGDDDGDNDNLSKAEKSCKNTTLSAEEKPLIGFKEQLKYIPSLLKFIIPLISVYILEYFINQGLFELVYFPDIWLDKSSQYRWLQVDYQIGVFISRSSVNIVQINQVWIMAVLQSFNVVYFIFEVLYFFTPSIWIIFAIVFFEGLLGGGAYVNTFYRITKEIHPNRKQFALAVTSISDSVGIALAGVFAIPTHNAICAIPLK